MRLGTPAVMFASFQVAMDSIVVPPVQRLPCLPMATRTPSCETLRLRRTFGCLVHRLRIQSGYRSLDAWVVYTRLISLFHCGSVNIWCQDCLCVIIPFQTNAFGAKRRHLSQCEALFLAQSLLCKSIDIASNRVRRSLAFESLLLQLSALPCLAASIYGILFGVILLSYLYLLS
jgi:hypothetical protein